jgi:nucleoside transporter
MRTATKIQLSIMMFLQFFVWGGWFVTLGSYLTTALGASGSQTAMAYSTQSWGAIVAPFFVGLIADRYFNAEKLLGILHLLGAALMYRLYWVRQFADFYPYLLTYMIVYMPTLALVNSISFRHLETSQSQFSRFRVWGTVGWIVAGLIISYVFAWDSRDALAHGMLRSTFLMCSAASLLLGLFSFTLPATPPKAATRAIGLGQATGSDARMLLRDQNFLVFFIASVLTCIPLAFYYQNANQFLTELHLAYATGKQTIGQASEVVFMLAIPFFLNRLGMKVTLLLGMLAWSVRYVLFAFGNVDGATSLLLIGIALHGVCYDFFFVSGQIYTDSKAGGRYKSSAQGMLTLATYGLGMLIGFHVAGVITDLYATGRVHDWHSIWLYPAAFAALLFVAFALSFRNDVLEYARSPA